MAKRSRKPDTGDHNRIVHMNIPMLAHQRDTIHQHAKAAGCTVQEYVIAMSTNGKINRKPL